MIFLSYLALEMVSSTIDITPVESPDFIYNFVEANQNSTMFGMLTWNLFAHLERLYIGIDFTLPNGTDNTIYYQIWYNFSLNVNGTDTYSRPMLSLIRGLDESISKFAWIIGV